MFYGPAPRSRADEVRARIAAEHEAARARREAEPEPEPTSGRWGSRCPICYEDWDVNGIQELRCCCCRAICVTCSDKVGNRPCPLCRAPLQKDDKAVLAQLRRHVENDVPESFAQLGHCYENGDRGLVKSAKKAAKLYKRGAELGNVNAMTSLAGLHMTGDGVKLDMKKAERLYRTAAEGGDPRALCCLGQFLGDAGLDFLKLSASHGYTGAERSLGCFYFADSAQQDTIQGIRWCARAAAKGDGEAKASIFIHVGSLFIVVFLLGLICSPILYWLTSSTLSFPSIFFLSIALNSYAYYRFSYAFQSIRPSAIFLIDLIVLALTQHLIFPSLGKLKLSVAVVATYVLRRASKSEDATSESFVAEYTFTFPLIIEPFAATLFLRYTTEAELAPSFYALFSACYAMSFYKSNRKRIQEAALPWFQGRIRGFLSDFLAFAIVRPLIAPSYSAVRYTATVIALQVIGSIFSENQRFIRESGMAKSPLFQAGVCGILAAVLFALQCLDGAPLDPRAALLDDLAVLGGEPVDAHEG